MPNWKAWVERSRDQSKEGVGGAWALKCCRITWLKVDNVLQEEISVIDLNHYTILSVNLIGLENTLAYYVVCTISVHYILQKLMIVDNVKL